WSTSWLRWAWTRARSARMSAIDLNACTLRISCLLGGAVRQPRRVPCPWAPRDPVPVVLPAGAAMTWGSFYVSVQAAAEVRRRREPRLFARRPVQVEHDEAVQLEHHVDRPPLVIVLLRLLPVGLLLLVGHVEP